MTNNITIWTMASRPNTPAETILHSNPSCAEIYIIGGGIFITMLILLGGMIWLTLSETKPK